MQKLVSIIIPFHNEPVYTVFNVLASINNQIGIDLKRVEVVLVNDGGADLPDGLETFKLLKNLNLVYVQSKEGHGPSAARQMGMERASGQYFMFIDVDDQLRIDDALLEFFQVADKGSHDIISARYVEQAMDINTNQIFYVFHGNDENYSIFSKWFNRNLIDRYQIKWAADLRYFEDTYFVGVAFELATDIVKLDSYVYSWLYHEQSTRQLTGKRGISFDDQLHIWARGRRYFLEQIKMYKPQRVSAWFTDYVADIYYRQKQFPPVDKPRFVAEQDELLSEFGAYWLPNRGQIMQTIINYSQPNAKFDGLNSDDALDFLSRLQQRIPQSQLVAKEAE